MLLDRELQARAGVPVERARTLPGSWYADPEHHTIEIERVFRRSWVGVVIDDEGGARGSYFATTVGAVPVLIVRDDAGVLRAFLNACRHRGSPLATDSGTARALQCP